MALENPESKESLVTAINDLKRRLGMQNINAVLHTDNEEPILMALDGALDNTEPAGNDTDIELVLQQVQKLYPEFTFEYNFQGSIAIHIKPKQIQ